jgi:hypothetical protein
MSGKGESGRHGSTKERTMILVLLVFLYDIIVPVILPLDLPPTHGRGEC